MAKVRTKQKIRPDSGSFDYEEFEKEAISRLKEGSGLVGPEGVLTGLIQRLVNAALSGEMSAHLKEERALGVENRRNGHTSKQLDTVWGLFRSTLRATEGEVLSLSWWVSGRANWARALIARY